jgi:hypothetical protein
MDRTLRIVPLKSRRSEKTSVESIEKNTMTDQQKKSEACRGAGRPPAYRHEFAQQAKKLCELGACRAELADFFEVSERTIQVWQRTHSEFGQAIEAGRIAPERLATLTRRLEQARALMLLELYGSAYAAFQR